MGVEVAPHREREERPHRRKKGGYRNDVKEEKEHLPRPCLRCRMFGLCCCMHSAL